MTRMGNPCKTVLIRGLEPEPHLADDAPVVGVLVEPDRDGEPRGELLLGRILEGVAEAGGDHVRLEVAPRSAPTPMAEGFGVEWIPPASSRRAWRSWRP